MMKSGISLKFMSKAILLVGSITSFSAVFGASGPWEEAQGLFNSRAEGRSKIAEARAKYLGLLEGSSTTSEKVQAVSQLGRLALYEGEILLAEDDIEGRRKVFSQCFCAAPNVTYNPLPQPSCDAPGFVEAISPKNLGEPHPAYHYFRAMCTAYFGEIAQPMEKLAYVSWLKEDLAAGRSLDTRFEGGGILRIAAGVYLNPKASVVLLYNPDLALSLASEALLAGAYPGMPSSGAQYYENYAILIDALQQLESDRPSSGYKEKAIAQVTKVLEEMEERVAFEDLPQGREPEFLWYFGRIKESYRELTGQIWPSNNSQN